MNFSTEVVSKLLDFYPAPAALIDEKCNILAVNRSWAQRAVYYRNHNNGIKGSEGQYYFTDPVFGAFAGDAVKVNSGILRVLSGASEIFTYNYQFGSPAARHWFRLTAAPFRPSEDLRWAILLHTGLANQHIETADLVTVCGWCKRLPEGQNWIHFEEYFSKRLDIHFSHGICPQCRDSVLQEIPLSSGAQHGV
jgi:hypothetical protein